MSKRKTKPQAPVNAPRKTIDIAPSASFIPWLIIITVLISLVFSNTTLDPAVSIRYLFYCIFIAAFITFVLLFKSRQYPFPIPPLLATVFLVGLAFCIESSIAMTYAINRKEGFFETSRTYANLFFLGIVLFITYYNSNKLLALFRMFVILAFMHSLIGILQYYQVTFTELPGNFAPYGLMANRNLYASAQALIIPFCLYVLFADNSNPWKYLTGFTLLVVFISLLLAQTRSAWLASALIIISSLILVSIFIPGLRKQWLLGTGIILAVTGILVFFFLSGSDNTLAASLKERSSSLVTPLSPGDSSVAVSNANERLVIWNKTLHLIKDHKTIGVGPGNWKIGIQAYGNKGLINEYGDYVLDHTHNIYLQLAAETGIPGLLLFLIFWFLVLFAAFKCLVRTQLKENDKLIVILCICGMGAFALDGFFSFPLERIEHTFYLYLFGGIVLGYYALSLEKHTLSLLSLRILFPAPLALSAFILFISKERYNFEVHAYRTKAFNKTNDYQNVIDEVAESNTPFAALDMNGDPLQMYSAIAYKAMKKYDLALAQCEIALHYHPYNSRVYNTLGTIYTETGNFPKAIEAYKKALTITPKADVTLKNLAINYFNVKQYADCLKILGQIRDVEKLPILIQIKSACLQAVK
jgi:O-antigen ligase